MSSQINYGQKEESDSKESRDVRLDSSKSERSGEPTQAIILAAGCGTQLKPFTDYEPKAFVPVAGMPMIQHTLSSFRKNSVTDFRIVCGHKSEVFEHRLKELGPGVSLTNNPRYEETRMFYSFLLGCSHAQRKGFYVAYSDIVFTENVAACLRAAKGDICVVVDRLVKLAQKDAQRDGRDAKPFHDVEGVSVEIAECDNSISVSRIGKGRCGQSWDDPLMWGEFVGLIKFTEVGAKLLIDAINELGIEFDSKGNVKQEKTIKSKKLPWYMQPLSRAHMCDILQYLIDNGANVVPVEIFGNWREVDTPSDLLRANNTLSYINKQYQQRELVAAMGSALLSEANDLKRPIGVLAKELNIDLGIINAFVKGDIEPEMAQSILQKMTETYPVALNDLWVERNDTKHGARLHTAAESEASSRVLERNHPSISKDPTNVLRSQYYDYRDTAMSRNGPFRPEWIKVLREVHDSDPENPDVQLNNGHLMMQTTFFIGPVNFYWRDTAGKRQCKEMNTGDSNFIAPFVPHSFANRDGSRDALIIAVTYSEHVKRALPLFNHLGGHAIGALSGDNRDADGARRARIKRQLDAECMTEEDLVAKLSDGGKQPDPKRARLLLEGAEPSATEAEEIATALNVKYTDLAVRPLTYDEDVSFCSAQEAAQNSRLLTTGDNSKGTSYDVRPLVRNRHQPDLKVFDIRISEGTGPGPELKVGLHEYVYHHGTEPVEVQWGANWEFKGMLNPGDSAYFFPLVPHRFLSPSKAEVALFPAHKTSSHPNGSDAAKGMHLVIVRIPGSLTTDTLNEFGLFRKDSWSRVGRETMRWYN